MYQERVPGTCGSYSCNPNSEQQQQQQQQTQQPILATIASYQNVARTLGLFLHGRKQKGKSILTNRNL